MKYLSLVVFAILLSSTWYVVNSEAAISLETHVGIQAKLGQLIVDTVKTKKPTATDIDIQSIWTEPFGDGQPARIKAHFSYHYSEASGENGKVDNSIEGEGILEKQADDGTGMDHWILNNVKTSKDSVFFEQPLVISTSNSDKAPDAAEPDTKE